MNLSQGPYTPAVRRFPYLGTWPDSEVKRTASILLIAALLLPFYGSWALLKWQQFRTKAEVKERLFEGLSPEETVTLRFSHAEADGLEWEHAREFEYRGRMYDVIRSRETAAFVEYVCYADDEESELKARIREGVARAMESDPRKADRSQRLLSLLKTWFPPGTSPEPPVPALSARAWRPFTGLKAGQILKAPPVPPPDRV